MQQGEKSDNFKGLLNKFFYKNKLFKIALILTVVFFVAIIVFVISFNTFYYLYRGSLEHAAYSNDKEITVSIPAEIIGESLVDQRLSARLTQVVEKTFSINQDAELFIDNDFTIPIDAVFSASIAQDVYLDTQIPLDVKLPVDGIKISISFLNIWDLNVPLKGDLLYKAIIPWKGRVHIKTMMPVRIRQDVSFHLKKRLRLPLDLNVNAQIPFDDVFNVDFKGSVKGKSRVKEPFQYVFNLRDIDNL